MAAVARGEGKALGTLYDRYGPEALGLAYRMLGERPLAEEVVQDAFLAVWRRAGSYDAGRGAPRSWLLGIVHHRAIDVLRRRAGRTLVDVDGLYDLADAADVWREAWSRLQREAIEAALGSLPPDQRRAIELAFFDGLTHPEIAAQTGQQLGTIKGRIRLGLRKLRAALEVEERETGWSDRPPWEAELTPAQLAKLLDPGRLAALRRTGLMESRGDEAFDRLAELAHRALRAPASLVTLIDADRQLFKGCLGLPEPWGTWRTMPLARSFCLHTVTTGEPLVVADAPAHRLFRDNVAVRSLGVVAYAGVPLVHPEGHVLGSFCVVDVKRRAWTPEDVATLRDMADAAMVELDLRDPGRETDEPPAAAPETETAPAARAALS